MEILTGILLFLLGVITGVVAIIYRNKWDKGAQQAQTASVATNLDEMSRHITANIQEAESLLTKEQKVPAFPFFSKEATEILQSADSKRREKSQLSDQPLDYSSKKSGVFQGEPPIDQKTA